MDEAQAEGRSSVTLSTRALAAEAPQALQLQVSNGQAGALRLGRQMPVQWVQAAARGGAAGSAAGASGAPAGAIVQGITWVPSGQGLWVRPRWPGGEAPVQLDLRFDSLTDTPTTSPLPSPSGGAFPAQQVRQVGTRLAVPMGIWTTFAVTGTPSARDGSSTVSTQALSDSGRQLMQVRVTAP